MYHYVGNCTNSFDEAGECILSCFVDVSDFAKADEEATELTKADFLAVAEIPKEIRRRIGGFGVGKGHTLRYLHDDRKTF